MFKMFNWQRTCLACLLLGAASGLPLHYGSLSMPAGVDVWPVPLILGLGLLAAAISIIAGCVCCHRLGKGAPAAIQGFNNATYDPSPGGELTLFPPISAVSAGGRPQFEPLPELTAAAAAAGVTAAHPRPAIYNLSVSRGFSAKDWFDDPHRNFPRQQLKYQEELGTGWFGQSLLGEARHLTAEPRTDVVVKALRAGATLPEQMYFLHEMSYLRDANHPNVLRLLGRCVEADPYLLILERCGVGDAKEFLQRRSPSERQQLLETMSLNKMAMDAAAGLQHLHDIHYTHSDLAARSCRVMSNCTLKLGDYGCNIDKYKEDYYIAGDVALPVRWCAPEVLECTPTTIETKEITKASNVWSLGVLMWELLAFAALPYAPLSDDDVIQHVVMDRNVQLSRPKLSSGSPHTDRMYHVMQLCWLPPSQRPTVHRIHALLSQLTVPPRDDFEERWEALRPRGRADGGSDSDSPEPLASQPASLDSELHDALRSLDRMLAAEETPADPAAAAAAVAAAVGGGGDGGDDDAEGAGSEEDADGPELLSPHVREQSRSVQDFLTLTAPLDSLEFCSERAESDPEPEGWQEAPVSTARCRPPVEGAPHAPGAATPPDPDPAAARGPALAAALTAAVDAEADADAADGGGAGEVGAGGAVDGRRAADTVEAPAADTRGGGHGFDLHAPHVVPELRLTEATPPRPAATGGSQTQSEAPPAEEPPTSAPRAFRFVLNNKSGRADSLEASEAGESVTAPSEYFTATDSTLACAATSATGDTVTEDSVVEDTAAEDTVAEDSGAEDSISGAAIQRQLTSTPRGRRSPSFGAYITSSQPAAPDRLPDGSSPLLMGSRHSAPAYAPVAATDDLSVGSDAACDAALLADELRDDTLDTALCDIRREVRRASSRPGAAGDVLGESEATEAASASEVSALPPSPVPNKPGPGAASPSHVGDLVEPANPVDPGDLLNCSYLADPVEIGDLMDPTDVEDLADVLNLADPASPTSAPGQVDRALSAELANLSEPAEPGSPPRSASLSSTFGHSTCDELAELPDEEEVRSLCSRAELAPSKLWRSADEVASSPARPDRRLSADAVTVIEALGCVRAAPAGDGVGPAAADEGAAAAAEEDSVFSEEVAMAAEWGSEGDGGGSAAAEASLSTAGEGSVAAAEGPMAVDEGPIAAEEGPATAGKGPLASKNEPMVAEVGGMTSASSSMCSEAPMTAEGAVPPAEKVPVCSEEVPTPAEAATLVEEVSTSLDEPAPVGEAFRNLEDSKPPNENLPSDEGLEKVASLAEGTPTDVLVSARRLHSTDYGAVAGVPVSTEHVPASADDVRLSPDVLRTAGEAPSLVPQWPVDVSTPDTESPAELLRAAVVEESPASEASSVPLEEPLSPSEDSSPPPQAGVLGAAAETPARSEPARSLPEELLSPAAEPRPLAGGPLLPTGLTSGGGLANSSPQQAPGTSSAAVEPMLAHHVAEESTGADARVTADDSLNNCVNDGVNEATAVASDGVGSVAAADVGGSVESGTEQSVINTTGDAEKSVMSIGAVGGGACHDSGSCTTLEPAPASDAPLPPLVSAVTSSFGGARPSDTGSRDGAELSTQRQPVTGAATAPGGDVSTPAERGRAMDGDDMLTSLDGSGGFELTMGDVLPPPAGSVTAAAGDGGDSSHKYQLNVEAETAERAPADPSEKYQVASESAAECGVLLPVGTRPAPAAAEEEGGFWQSLQRAAAQTQRLVEEARRQSPRRDYRAMFLERPADPAEPEEAADGAAPPSDGAFDSLASLADGSGRVGGDDEGGFDPLASELALELDDTAALDAVRAELRRALPALLPSQQEEEEKELELALDEAELICPPVVPGLATISEEGEEEEEEERCGQEEDRPPDQIPDSWREDDFVEVEIKPVGVSQCSTTARGDFPAESATMAKFTTDAALPTKVTPDQDAIGDSMGAGANHKLSAKAIIDETGEFASGSKRSDAAGNVRIATDRSSELGPTTSSGLIDRADDVTTGSTSDVTFARGEPDGSNDLEGPDGDAPTPEQQHLLLNTAAVSTAGPLQVAGQPVDGRWQNGDVTGAARRPVEADEGGGSTRQETDDSVPAGVAVPAAKSPDVARSGDVSARDNVEPLKIINSSLDAAACVSETTPGTVALISPSGDCDKATPSATDGALISDDITSDIAPVTAEPLDAAKSADVLRAARDPGTETDAAIAAGDATSETGARATGTTDIKSKLPDDTLVVTGPAEFGEVTSTLPDGADEARGSASSDEAAGAASEDDGETTEVAGAPPADVSGENHMAGSAVGAGSRPVGDEQGLPPSRSGAKLATNITAPDESPAEDSSHTIAVAVTGGSTAPERAAGPPQTADGCDVTVGMSPAAAAAPRAVSAELLAELRALAAEADSRVTPAGAAGGSGDGEHRQQQQQEQRDRAAPSLRVQDLESPVGLPPTAAGRPDSRPDSQAGSLTDSDASDVLEVDTESLEARLLEGGRPRSHVAFVLRAPPPPPPPPPAEQQLEAKFDLTRSDGVRGDQIGGAEDAQVEEDSDYEGDYESLPVDGAAPAAAPAGGLTRSVASYDLAGGAATSGWPAADWEYPTPAAPAPAPAPAAAAAAALEQGMVQGEPGQPASLPANPSYHVLSQGEMYHKSLRRNSLPTASGELSAAAAGGVSSLPLTTLTAEELDIDASIPTYDDVREFGDDALSSSDSEAGGGAAWPPPLRYARTQTLEEAAETLEPVGAGERDGGDQEWQGRDGGDDRGGMELERPHRPPPGADEPDESGGAPEEEVADGAAPKSPEWLERPSRPEPGARVPDTEPAHGRLEAAAAAAAAAATPEESRWSPEAPAAAGRDSGEAAFLDDDDDEAPWLPADALALRSRLQVLNDEFDESAGQDGYDGPAGRPDRADRLRQLNEQWGVPQASEPGRYTPDWEPDDDEDEDGLSSTSGEFVWQEGVDRLAAESRDSDSASASDSDSESGEEEFTPSVWQRDKEPGHGLLRSPEHKSELRKSVSFKRQKHHRIYEYPGAPESPSLGLADADLTATDSQDQRKAWSFVAPASVSHYTDWELDDEEIEDVSLTELPESPERQPPRLPAAAAAASHYFLSAGGDDDADDGDDEFFIRPGLAVGPYGGGSSFTPGEVFPAEGNVWGSAARDGGVWGTAGRGGHAWEPGAEAETDGAPADVWGRPVGTVQAAPEGRFVDVWATTDAARAAEQGPVEADSASERPLDPSHPTDSQTASEKEVTRDPPRLVAETESASAAGRQPERCEPGDGEARVAAAAAMDRDVTRGGAAANTAAAAGDPAVTAAAAEERQTLEPDHLSPTEAAEAGTGDRTTGPAESAPQTATAPALADTQPEPLNSTAPGDANGTAAAVADSMVTNPPAAAAAAAAAPSSNGAAPHADLERTARPARDKLFLDLTGAPADAVDSGYTGSCDDRTVAAFVALDGTAE